MSHQQCMDQDLQLANHFLNGKDYHEGVKALLIEHREPKWSDSSIEEIPDDEVEHYFTDSNRGLKAVPLSRYPAATVYTFYDIADRLLALDEDLNGEEIPPDVEVDPDFIPDAYLGKEDMSGDHFP